MMVPWHCPERQPFFNRESGKREANHETPHCFQTPNGFEWPSVLFPRILFQIDSFAHRKIEVAKTRSFFDSLSASHDLIHLLWP